MWIDVNPTTSKQALKWSSPRMNLENLANVFWFIITHYSVCPYSRKLVVHVCMVQHLWNVLSSLHMEKQC